MKKERKFFTKVRDAIALPNLIEVQLDSYSWFFKHGLRELFDEISPIKDFIGRDLELSFGEYAMDKPKFDEVTARERNVTHEASLRVKAKLTNIRTKECREQEVYLGDFPLMTPRGTFVINGVERVVVSQLVRSAGILFSGQMVDNKYNYSAQVIPNRGAWLEFEVDQRGVIWVRIDRKRKIAATSMLRAFGFGTTEQILETFKDLDEAGLEYIQNTLRKDIATSEEEGLIEVYKKIRPGDLATVDNAKQLIYATFFNFDRYDFGRPGRYKIKQRLDLDFGDDKASRILHKEDVIAVIKELIRLTQTQDLPDDIDHLSNRRVRGIGEQLQNRLRIGLARMERIVKDRMSTSNVKSVTPGQLINARPVDGVIKEFFMTSQLSQFMEQINPLAELGHKRRLSVLGTGGLSRERAGFEVRDVHTTYYSRICPIATPEGPNIGLVGHLASYARINEYGFIEAPYRKVLREVPNNGAAIVNKIIGEDILDGKKIVAKAGERATDKLAKELAKIKELEVRQSSPWLPKKPCIWMLLWRKKVFLFRPRLNWMKRVILLKKLLRPEFMASRALFHLARWTIWMFPLVKLSVSPLL